MENESYFSDLEKELMELEEYLRTDSRCHKVIVSNLLSYYIQEHKTEKIKQLRRLTNVEELMNLVDATYIYSKTLDIERAEQENRDEYEKKQVEASTSIREIRDEVEKAKEDIDGTSKEVFRTNERIEKERTRYIEILGVFSAIVAFIFTGLEIVSKFDFSQAILAIPAIAVSLMTFILAIHIIVTERKYMAIIFFFIGVIFYLALCFCIHRL